MERADFTNRSKRQSYPHGNLSCCRGGNSFILSDWQKEGFSHQLHSESESVGEGVALGDAVHLVHAFFEFFQRFFLLFRKRTVQLLAIPGYQLK